MRWNMHEFSSSQRPPFAEFPRPSAMIKGKTYYDWSRKSMTEIYQERCIDIFPRGRDFPCQFLSVDEKTFFIVFAPDKSDQIESCCLWRKDKFYAPRPDVLNILEKDQDMDIQGSSVSWWILDIELPGPFGYGLYANTNVPYAFWFPVISGWVQQNFHQFKHEKPNPEVFEIPMMCKKHDLEVCEQPNSLR
jgi:hypothetical protein